MNLSQNFLEKLESIKKTVRKEWENENVNSNFLKKQEIKDSFLVYEDLGYSISSPNLLKDLENIRINLNKKIEEEFLNKQNNIKIINMEDNLYQNIENIIFGVQVNYLKLETDDVYEKRIDIFFENHFKNNLNKYLSFNTINDDYIVLILKDINENIVIEHKLFYTNIVKNKEKILERLEEKLNVFYHK